MAKKYFDRYSNFKIDNKNKVLPFIKILGQPTDIIIQYKNNTRLDIVSQHYYDTPYYGWLIMLANPQFGGLEFNIPDGTEIRIPFPLPTALQNYQQQVNQYNVLYGIND